MYRGPGRFFERLVRPRRMSFSVRWLPLCRRSRNSPLRDGHVRSGRWRLRPSRSERSSVANAVAQKRPSPRPTTTTSWPRRAERPSPARDVSRPGSSWSTSTLTSVGRCCDAPARRRAVDGRAADPSGRRTTGLSQPGAAQTTGGAHRAGAFGVAPGPLVGPVGLAVHVDVVRAVDDAVEDRLGDDGVREQRVPVRGRSVGREDRALARSFGDQLVEVVGLGRGELPHGEIVEDEDGRPCPAGAGGSPRCDRRGHRRDRREDARSW